MRSNHHPLAHAADVAVTVAIVGILLLATGLDADAAEAAGLDLVRLGASMLGVAVLAACASAFGER